MEKIIFVDSEIGVKSHEIWMTAVTLNTPSVNMPVLSKATAVIPPVSGRQFQGVRRRRGHQHDVEPEGPVRQALRLEDLLIQDLRRGRRRGDDSDAAGIAHGRRQGGII